MKFLATRLIWRTCFYGERRMEKIWFFNKRNSYFPLPFPTKKLLKNHSSTLATPPDTAPSPPWAGRTRVPAAPPPLLNLLLLLRSCSWWPCPQPPQTWCGSPPSGRPANNAFKKQEQTLFKDLRRHWQHILIEKNYQRSSILFRDFTLTNAIVYM